MSCHEWESGTLTLPAAEVAPMRKALNFAHAAEVSSVKALLDRLWPELKKLPVTERAHLFYDYRFQRAHAAVDDETWFSLYELFRVSKGRKPTAEHWKKALDAPSTNRTRSWHCGEVSVGLDGRHLTWDVPQNNHAVDEAHERWLGKALFAQLGRVKWTRGSGGVLVGNNEYAREDCSPGGGGNYITYAFGPAGEKAERHYSGFVVRF